MKLSEVIKAIEDGSKSEYKFGSCIIKREKSYIRMNSFDNSIFSFDFGTQWQEVKPPRQWSEKELWVFKCLSFINWIAKDEYGNGVWGFKNKPYECNEDWYCEGEGFGISLDELFDFLTITFEESPVYIGDLKGE